ncbi:MAG: sterol desaturase family protein [Gammaproteobacteria bacterium]|nr:sterol desaturase family protein [Gammaproteobacteria bacterium]
MLWLIIIPAISFLVLFAGEMLLPDRTLKYCYHRWDWLLNMTGFAMQGLVVPLCGYWIATHILPTLWPAGKGVLPLNGYGAFLLNFVGVDFLYYWQHRLFHHVPLLWRWHRCHHASPRVDIWATARNSIFVNFFFVYLLVNPLLGFMCKDPSGFFLAATFTASLDLARHTAIHTEKMPLLHAFARGIGYLFVTPSQHHRHHLALSKPANFGANFIIWDKLFKTFCVNMPQHLIYQDPEAPHPLQQLLYPFKD